MRQRVPKQFIAIMTTTLHQYNHQPSSSAEVHDFDSFSTGGFSTASTVKKSNRTSFNQVCYMLLLLQSVHLSVCPDRFVPCGHHILNSHTVERHFSLSVALFAFISPSSNCSPWPIQFMLVSLCRCVSALCFSYKNIIGCLQSERGPVMFLSHVHGYCHPHSCVCRPFSLIIIILSCHSLSSITNRSFYEGRISPPSSSCYASHNWPCRP